MKAILLVSSICVGALLFIQDFCHIKGHVYSNPSRVILASPSRLIPSTLYRWLGVLALIIL